MQGYDDKPISSGYAIYRTWFNAQEVGIDKDPLTEFLARDKDVFNCWIGKYPFPKALSPLILYRSRHAPDRHQLPEGYTRQRSIDSCVSYRVSYVFRTLTAVCLCFQRLG